MSPQEMYLLRWVNDWYKMRAYAVMYGARTQLLLE